MNQEINTNEQQISTDEAAAMFKKLPSDDRHLIIDLLKSLSSKQE